MSAGFLQTLAARDMWLISWLADTLNGVGAVVRSMDPRLEGVCFHFGVYVIVALTSMASMLLIGALVAKIADRKHRQLLNAIFPELLTEPSGPRATEPDLNDAGDHFVKAEGIFVRSATPMRRMRSRTMSRCSVHRGC